MRPSQRTRRRFEERALTGKYFEETGCEDDEDWIQL
jgi:hypothetical protein